MAHSYNFPLYKESNQRAQALMQKLDIKFNAGSIKSKDIGEGGINGLTDWFCEIHHVLEHQRNVGKVAVDMQGLYESVCLGAMGVTSDEFLRICGYCFGDEAGQVTADEGNMARLYRMGRIPRMLGLSFTEAEQLWKIMAGGEDGLLLTMGSLTYSMEPLKIIWRTEILLAWMDSHGLDIITFQGMVTKDYGSTATPELYNFLAKVYQAAAGVTLATRAEESLPEEKLYRALAAGFDIKPNVMSRC